MPGLLPRLPHDVGNDKLVSVHLND